MPRFPATPAALSSIVSASVIKTTARNSRRGKLCSVPGAMWLKFLGAASAIDTTLLHFMILYFPRAAPPPSFPIADHVPPIRPAESRFFMDRFAKRLDNLRSHQEG